jgi:hypothetical protein
LVVIVVIIVIVLLGHVYTYLAEREREVALLQE